MSKDPKTPAVDSELIQRVVAALMASVAAPTPAPAAPKPDVNLSARKGRRYGSAEKKEILAAASLGKKPEELEAEFGVARETVSRWERREARTPGSVAGTTPLNPVVPVPPAFNPDAVVADQSSPPKDNHKGYYPHWKEVLKTWRSRPGLGPAQIKNQLHRAGIKVTVATVRKILEENGYTPHKAAVKEVEINRYEAVRPLEIVHMDFKHFYINKAKVYLLLLQDDFSDLGALDGLAGGRQVSAIMSVCRFGTGLDPVRRFHHRSRRCRAGATLSQYAH